MNRPERDHDVLAVWGTTALLGLDAGSAFTYTITTGALLQTLTYVTVAAVGSLWFLRLRHTSSAVVGVLALLVTGYTLYSSVYPSPPAPLKYLPYGVTAYLLVVLAVTLVAPHFLRRVAVVDRCRRRS